MSQSGETLINQVNEASPDRTAISEKVSDVANKFDDLKDKLRTKETELEDEINKAKDFNENLKELDDWLSATRDDLATQKPVGVDPAVIQKQLLEIVVRRI